MKSPQPKTTFEAIGKILGVFPNIASLILGGTALAYLIGWLYAKEYFGVFGARWLLAELPTSALLGYSSQSVAFLLFLCYLATLDLEESDKTEKWMTAVSGKGRKIIIFFLVLQIVFQSFKWQMAYIITSYLFATAMTFYAAASFGRLIIEMKNPKFKWNLVSTYLTFGILLSGLYFAPTNLGRAKGLSDIDPSSMNLPVVKIRNIDAEFKLLHQRDGTFYVFTRDTTKYYPEILVIGKADVISIQKKRRVDKDSPAELDQTDNDSARVNLRNSDKQVSENNSR